MTTTGNCNTCANYRPTPSNPRDALAGTYKVCFIDPGHPGARFSDPSKACRLNPIRWTRT